ncbi:hypothetical protein HYH02_007831 [Chlamydomonas schloesseri]|uniref:Cyclic nucleotide-binding domain-containing protein n=1 Tax=Chlamydomonas schloesseri TaxID=2026947 RepID=A0A836B418_9CHLO|nr:hypothetical protein HYH02_007831 [Chlamydomonas schloesseri]|eukprot:KAG2447081.1 hypothetical protein HYH02_007831 [Chlamydomonas schloesseri]
MRIADLLDEAASSRHGSASGEAPAPEAPQDGRRRTSTDLARSSDDTSTTAWHHMPANTSHGGSAPLGKQQAHHRLSILSDGSADASLKLGRLGGDASHHRAADAYAESDAGYGGGSSHHGRHGDGPLMHANSSSLHGGAGSARANPWKKVNSAVKVKTALGGMKGGMGKRGHSGGLSLHSRAIATAQSSADGVGRDGEPLSGEAGSEAAARASSSGVRRALAAAKAQLQRWLSMLVISPDAAWYSKWWFFFAVGVALVSCWTEPFNMAFVGSPLVTGSMSWLDPIEDIILATFLLDFVLKFFVTYDDPETGILVTTQPKMAMHYVKSWVFVLDVLGCFPYDTIATRIAEGSGVTNPNVLTALNWLKLLTLARVYRVFDLFTLLDYRMMLSQGALMILRNYTYVFFTTHWASCIFYQIAREEGFSDDTWIGSNPDYFVHHSVWQQYVMALYFSVTVFTAMGDAAMFPTTVAEMATMIVYLMFNLFLAAYIIGTVTIMMVKQDEHSQALRESIENLNEYSQDNELPEKLHTAMKEHLLVNFDAQATNDDNVLRIYPVTIRRHALRHLYMEPVKGCFLFKGCQKRFLDAILTAARVEFFLPGVEILTEGDNVVDLMIIVAGEVMVTTGGGGRMGGNSYSGSMVGSSSMGLGSERVSFSGGPRASSASFSGALPDDSSHGGGGSLHGDPLSPMSPGAVSFSPAGAPKPKFGRFSAFKRGSSDALAEVAFFTEGASHEAVVGTSPVRVLSLPRTAWELLVVQFPQQARIVLENLQRHTEAGAEEALKAAAARKQLTPEQLHVALALATGNEAVLDETEVFLLADTRDAMTQSQIEMLTRLEDVRSTTSAHVRKVDEKRTFEFLNTAAQGDLESLRTMLRQGLSPNTSDYDGRTGLMLAAAKGHEAAVRLFLDAGCEMNRIDAFGNSAMAEAAKGAHDKIVELLLNYGASLGAGGLTVASDLCTAVYKNDLVKLRRLLRAGAPPDACDYDNRCALHIAGSEGNLEALTLLVEEGNADVAFQDRWGNTALDEARRVGAAPVVAYLEGLLKGHRHVSAEDAEKIRQQAARDFMGWCGLGDAAKLREAGGYAAGEQAGCAFAGLMLAASKGHTAAVEALLAGMPPDALRRTAPTAMLEAARVGHEATVAAFRAVGVALKDPMAPHLRAELRNVVQQGDAALVLAYLTAGVAATGSSCGSSSSSSRANGGGTLLHLATEHAHLAVLRRLLEQGGAVADLAAVDGAGRTPLQVAEAALGAQPSEPRVRAVHEYLVWAVSATGTKLGSVAVLAALRWGPVDTPPPPPAAPPADAQGLALADDPIAAETMPGAGLDAMHRAVGSGACRGGDSTNTVPALGGPASGTGVASPRSHLGAQIPVSTLALAAASTSGHTVSSCSFPGCGGGAAAGTGTGTGTGTGAGASAGGAVGGGSSTAPLPKRGSGAMVAVDDGVTTALASGWDNLPGTPENSTRGGSLARGALSALKQVADAQIASAAEYAAAAAATMPAAASSPFQTGVACYVGGPALHLSGGGGGGAATGAASPMLNLPPPAQIMAARTASGRVQSPRPSSSAARGAAMRLFGSGVLPQPAVAGGFAGVGVSGASGGLLVVPSAAAPDSGAAPALDSLQQGLRRGGTSPLSPVALQEGGGGGVSGEMPSPAPSMAASVSQVQLSARSRGNSFAVVGAPDEILSYVAAANSFTRRSATLFEGGGAVGGGGGGGTVGGGGGPDSAAGDGGALVSGGGSGPLSARLRNGRGMGGGMSFGGSSTLGPGAAAAGRPGGAGSRRGSALML